MANNQIAKEEIKKLLEIPGEVRGQVFLTDFRYIQDKFGEQGTSALRKKLKEWGTPINFEEVKATAWFPIGLRVISLLAIKEVFNWSEKDIFNLGNAAPKYSFIVRMLLKYFLSPQKTFQESPKYWEKHYTIGKLEAYRFIEEKNEYTLRLKDFKVHPILCPYLRGYFVRMGQYVRPERGAKITGVETKCVFKGDPFHEFVLRWK